MIGEGAVYKKQLSALLLKKNALHKGWQSLYRLLEEQ